MGKTAEKYEIYIICINSTFTINWLYNSSYFLFTCHTPNILKHDASEWLYETSSSFVFASRSNID